MIIGLLCFLFAIYALLIFGLMVGSKMLSSTHRKQTKAKTEFTIIVPFRNEVENLPNLVASIAELKYPKEQIFWLFVNDDSTDDSCKVIHDFSEQFPEIQLQILQNERASNSPKKDAIQTAISKTTTEWIVTTDADCILPKNWLYIFDQEITAKQPKMLVAPVTYKTDVSFFSYFQLLDFLSLQATTMGSFGLRMPFMCNGANLAYQKEAFLEVNGFTGNESIASGDDVFLLEKFVQKWADQVMYVKSREAIVETFPVKNTQQLIAQRTRWAAKSSHFSLSTGKIIGVIILLMNISCCMLPILVFTSSVWKLLSVLFLCKVMIDSIFLLQIMQFTQQKVRPFQLFISCVMYPFFSSFILFRMFFTKYTWKGRTFKK